MFTTTLLERSKATTTFISIQSTKNIASMLVILLTLPNVISLDLQFYPYNSFSFSLSSLAAQPTLKDQ